MVAPEYLKILNFIIKYIHRDIVRKFYMKLVGMMYKYCFLPSELNRPGLTRKTIP